MSCQRCKSPRILLIRARAKDMHDYKLGQEDGAIISAEQSYALDFSADGDTTEIDVCLECGQVQGPFPMTSALEREFPS